MQFVGATISPDISYEEVSLLSARSQFEWVDVLLYSNYFIMRRLCKSNGTMFNSAQDS